MTPHGSNNQCTIRRVDKILANECNATLTGWSDCYCAGSRPSGVKELIPDLATWVQCFSLYTATIDIHKPQLVSELTAYQTIIAKASMMYKWPSWVIYDQTFCQEVQRYPSQSWAKVDPGVHVVCSTDQVKVSRIGAVDYWSCFGQLPPSGLEQALMVSSLYATWPGNSKAIRGAERRGLSQVQ